jgi:glutathione S-transferase
MRACTAQGQAKLEARKKLAAPGSKLHEWLGKIDAKLGANPSGFAVGDSLTMADLRCFCELSSMISGWYDGIPASLLVNYSNIQKHRAKIASLPEVI